MPKAERGGMGAHKERRPELKGREREKDKGQTKRLWCQGKKLGFCPAAGFKARY